MSITELPDGSTSEPLTPAARRNPAWAAFLLRLHFYAGVLVAPFLLVAALTGLAYTVAPQLDRALYGDVLTAAPGGSPKPLAEQVAAARAAHPEGTVAAVLPGTDGATTRVVFAQPDLGDRQHTVYVDPHTARVEGQLTTWFDYTPVTTWLDDLHRNLHLGDLGRHYSEIAASWLWILAVGGVVLWWRRRGVACARVRHLLVPDLSARRGVRRTRAWHAATGVWLAVGLLFLSATGLTWSRYAGGHFGSALDALRAGTPEISTSLTGAPPSGGGEHQHGGVTAGSADPAAFDRVLAAATGAGLTGPMRIVPAEASGDAWTVAQTDSTWPVGRDRIAVDPVAGTVTARSDFADWPLLAKLSSLGVAAHMGLLFGPVNQVLLAALALGLLCVIVWGYRMWWQRRPTRADRRAAVGAPPARGGLRGLPWWALPPGLALTVAVGWALPWFGGPLLAFVVVDVVLGALARRRRRAVPVSPAPAGG
ncbi:PepSY-associated TM helix domain-containing protein [Micromonospora sp. NPDC002575]|uniref:PepSY-associated TM helix domain-containing protein n=1 Tax=Micromonospora sp. NPDC002575 TaxID=3364222 RepID=UPI003690FA09